MQEAMLTWLLALAHVFRVIVRFYLTNQKSTALLCYLLVSTQLMINHDEDDIKIDLRNREPSQAESGQVKTITCSVEEA